MQVEAIQCEKCKRVLFARVSGEWRCCTCGQTSISAEEDYLRISCGGLEVQSSSTFILDLGEEISPQLLSEDRTNNWNEWGVMPCRIKLHPGLTYELLENGDFKEIPQAPAVVQTPPPVVPFKQTLRRKKT